MKTERQTQLLFSDFHDWFAVKSNRCFFIESQLRAYGMRGSNRQGDCKNVSC